MDEYLLSFTVRVTTVIQETRVASLESGVYEFVRVEGHEVVVVHASFGIMIRTSGKLIVVQQLSYILHHKCAAAKRKREYMTSLNKPTSSTYTPLPAQRTILQQLNEETQTLSRK